MVKKLLALLLGCLLTQSVLAAGYVQAVSASANSGAITTSAITVTAGDALLVCISGDATVTSVSDSQGDTFTAAPSSPQTGYYYLYVYYVASAKGGSTTFSSSSSNAGGMTVAEFSGESTSSLLDKTNTGADSSQITSHPGVSITTTATEDIFACASNHNIANNSTFTAGSGWTTNSSLWVASNTSNNPSFGEYHNAADAAAYSGAFTSSTGSYSDYYILSMNPASVATCTHAGWTKGGAETVPTSGSTVVLLKTGGFGTVDCSTTNYWQPALGNWGVSMLWRYQPLWQRQVSFPVDLAAMAH